MRLTTGLANGFSISPDGKMIAHYFMGDTPDNTHWRWRIKVISFDGGQELKSFDVLPALMNRFIKWTPDGNALAYTCDTGGVSNIWIQPIDGAPKQITDFRSERIYAFDWSRDGQQIALARAAESSYVALITDSQ